MFDGLASRTGSAPNVLHIARMRYRGQGHELEVLFEPGMTPAALGKRFAAMHMRRYGFELPVPGGSRLGAVGAVGRHEVGRAVSRQGASAWRAGTSVDDGGLFDATVRGRRVIALPDATMLIPDGWTATALPIGGWFVERDA